MYPSSSTSSSQGSMRPTGLIRYDSAPGSFLSNAVDSVDCPSGSRPHHQLLARSHCFPTGGSADTSINSESNNPKLRVGIGEGSGQTISPYFLNESGGSSSFNLRTDGGGPSTASNSLIRHSSSPAGFLNHLAASVSTAPFCTTANNGFPVVTRGMGSSFNSRGIGEGSSNERGIPITRLNSQLSFTRQEELSLISEEGHENIETRNDRKLAQSYNCTSSFGAASGSNWEVNSNTNTIAFSSPNKRPKGINNTLDARNIDSMETQLQFGLTTHDQGALEMNRMDKLLHNIPPDSVPCKLRAKRGFATHPRSIAERERRTRISGKLKKLQELVPNMDKQTSYADMLDLAVQQIKGLQKQVEKLENEMQKCTCGCKPSTGTS